MKTYKVSGNGVQVSVESDNWLFAVALSLPQLGLDPSSLDQLVCSMGPDGTVTVVDATSRIPVRIDVEAEDAATVLDIPDTLPEPPAAEAAEEQSAAQPVSPPVPARAPRARRAAPASPAEVPAAETLPDVAAPEEEPGAEVADEPVAEEPVGAAEPMSAEARAKSTAPARLTEALARREEIQAAEDADSACEIALRIVTELVEAESGAVLQRLYQTRSLSFVAAVGPRASRVLGTTLPAATGIAGFAFTSGLGLIVQDVDTDGRFTSTVDSASGYRTRSALAMPIRVVDGPIFGCLELLNAPDGFHATDLEIVRVVALALGRRLRVASE
ncbi:MAG: GAF domain-containing protein [Myxococcota bacterium]